MPERVISASPTVSVIVVNWNNREDLVECLTSLRKQSFREFEAIVVDNGSTDGSVEMMHAKFPEVRVTALPANRGFSVANNRGMRQARGRYIALLNNDAFPRVDWLEHMCRGLENNPEVGFCASKILCYPDVERIDTVGDTFSILGKGLKTGTGEHDHGQYETPRLVFGACAAAAMYRRAMLDEIGSFDEAFSPANGEDVDLSFRAQLAGYRCLYVPQAVVHHRVSATLRQHGPESLYLHARNSEYIFWKNMPLPLVLLLAPLHVLYISLAFVYHSIRRRGGLYLRSKWDACRQLPALLRKRRVIQRQRRISALQVWRMLDRHLLHVWPRGESC
jgi:GT2 family glycosyltransferase